jgi:hypothetical protein
MFSEDTTLQVIDIRALPVNEGDEHVTLAMLTAVQTPFAGPDGQPVVLPVKVYKVPLNKTSAQELIESLRDESDKLPDPKRPSDLIVPGSPADVDRAAQALGKFR